MANKKRVKSRKDGGQTPPTKQSSRRQRYRAQQTKSWMSFLGKLALFFVPVTLASIWLVWLLIGFGTELPVLVLDLEKRETSDPTEPKRQRVWNCETYGQAWKDGFIQLPETITFGGPNKDALVIFNDLLATTRRNTDGEAEPCVFMPANEEEHQSHAFFGLLNDSTSQYQQQWKPFKDYLNGILKQLAVQTPSGSDKRKILLALDIDHPDLPGRLPPQANQFVGLCKSQWESLTAELAETFPQFDVYVWLSHAPGQKSYWNSNCDYVESFFKHRFERGLTGDVCIEIPLQQRSKRDVSYLNLKQYMGKRVASDASNHYLIQTPTFLEPKKMVDFPLLRFSNPLQSAVAEPGKMFGYCKRDKLPELDKLWEKYHRVRHEYEWTISNPLAIQQTNMLLLQMERLWYEGKGKTELFAALSERVSKLLDTHYTIKPVQHSISDALADAQRMDDKFAAPNEFQTDWLLTLPDYNLLPKGDERAALEGKSDARKNDIRKWQAKYPDWRGVHMVWQSLLTPPGGIIDREMIQRGLNLLTDEQTLANKNTQTVEGVVFDEVMFMQRLVDELIWPDKERHSNAHANFERLIQSALVTRDKSNRFIAMLNPVLTDQFAVEFEKLESERRLYEDRLFAHDDLSSIQYSQLIEKYESLMSSSENCKRNFAAAQLKLVTSIHDFRYRLVTLASADNDASETNWINEYFTKARDLSYANIDAFFSSEPTAELYSKAAADQPFLLTGRWPDEDLMVYKDKGRDLNLGVADGNLLGRRLVFWSELPLQDRRRLHEGLSTQYVTLDNDESGDVDSANDAQVSLVTEQGGLQESLVAVLRELPMMQATTEPVNVPSSEEQFFMQVAAKSSQLIPIIDYSETGQTLAELVNGFYARKSNLDFRRTSYDLCGTKVGDSTYVQKSLKMHQQLIESRLSELSNRQADPELSLIRDRVGEVWRDTYDKTAKPTWQERLLQVDEFCKAFRSWDWDREKQQAVSRSLVDPMNSEIDQDNKMLFSVSAVGAEFDKITGSVVDRSKLSRVALSTQELAEARVRLKLYLRGHHHELETQAAHRIKIDRLTVKLKNQSVHGTKLRVQRAAKAPVLGRVKILIDCSNSMGSGENSLMERSKKYVKGFLESAAGRADIEVSLYAFGVSVHHDGKGVESINSAQLSAWAQVNPNDDVWRYQGNGNRLDTSTQAGFTDAVAQLNAFGETPILAALDVAMEEKVDKSQLLVLLTDGFEYSKEKGQYDPRSFHAQQRYAKVRGQLNEPLTDLVIFNMTSVNVGVQQQLSDLTQEQQSVLRKQFASSISSRFGLSEIVKRIGKINALADVRDVGNGKNLNRLKQFFDGVLPRPVVERTPPFGSLQDLPTEQPGTDMIRVVQLGPEDRPKSWQLGMRFQTDSRIKIFNKTDRQWTTNQQTYGNERLDFVYNPVRGSFKLVTDWEQKDDSKEFAVGSQQLLIHSSPTRIDKPSFLVASTESQSLTPAPAMIWAVLSQKDQRKQMLLQDFNLENQTRSNVHRIEFPEVEEVWRDEAIFKQGLPIDLTLHWLDRFPADYWSKLNLADVSDQLVIANENGVQVKLEQDRFVSLAKLFRMDTVPFKGFDFKLQYKNLDDGNFKLITRISFPEEADNLQVKDLDRWMVQVLSSDGTTLHRGCRLESKRHYILKSQSAGGQKLAEIEHELSVDREVLKRTGGHLGFANLDEVEAGNANITLVPFPKYDD